MVTFRRDYLFFLAAASLLVSGLLYTQLLGSRPLNSWLNTPKFGTAPATSDNAQDEISHALPEPPVEYAPDPLSEVPPPPEDPVVETPVEHAPGVEKHPIALLIEAGQREFDKLNQRPILDVYDAAEIYRQRRGRHPPPGFDAWVEYALMHQSRLNEHFFDQIYEDLEPFWALDPLYLRTFARLWDGSMSIRGGKLNFRHATMGFNQVWIRLWTEQLTKIAPFLPDLDMAFNNVDEPRITIPFDDMSAYMAASAATKHTNKPTAENPILDEYSVYPDIEGPPEPENRAWNDDTQFWHKIRDACPPKHGIRDTEMKTMLDESPDFIPLPTKQYVENATASRNICENPHLRNLHGIFLSPTPMGISRKLYPLFSACKITGVNNDILLPAAMYFNDNPIFDAGNMSARHFPWHDKKAMSVWRGSPSGGISSETTWKWFQRQRMMSMLNATTVTVTEKLHFSQEALSTQEQNTLRESTGENFYLPEASKYPLAALETEPTTLGAWTATLSDCGFSTLMCRPGPWCTFMVPYFSELPHMKLTDMFKYKYLPDVDGMSYSGRYRSFLESSSVPFKATLFSEWHDSRLVPWYHYVPMDNTFKDWWGLMEFFAGYDPDLVSNVTTNGHPILESFRRPAHDDEARRIGQQGQFWSERVLRQTDMIVYMYRLLLEYARVCDDNRESMGWTADLTGN